MTAIRPKDKVFLAVSTIVIGVAAYLFCFRFPMTERLNAHRAHLARLVNVVDFEDERVRLTRLAEAAERELGEAKKEVIPASDDEKTGLARDAAIVGTFRENGLLVRSISDTRLEAKTFRAYRLSGTYPAVWKALLALDASRTACVVALTMTGTHEWEITVR